jgi:hypothetical protein
MNKSGQVGEAMPSLKFSSLKARCTSCQRLFLDSIGIKFEYEQEKFELPNLGRYIPDLWLPQVHMWAEIKPGEFDERSLAKAKALSKLTQKPILKFIDSPAFQYYFSLAYTNAVYAARSARFEGK